ncbi:MAG: 2'-5' RNA ligase family protein [Stellaceae bacterium]|jgi:2'-5' RNA ligase
MLRLQSAIVVLVPEAEQLVGPFREKHDPSARAGMPSHITLLYPFKSPREISEVVFDTLNQCFTRFEAFDFSFTTIRRFSPEVLYLAPEPDESFRRLTLAVWDCYPETPPYGGRYSSITPHLTVAQLADEQQLERIAVEFARASERGLPIHATASEIALMDTLEGSWQVRATFTLR